MSPGQIAPGVVRRHLLAINERLDDFGEFARHIDRHLRSQPGT